MMRWVSWEKGSISYKDLLKLNQRALYITETIGHGSNLVTGDYSVGATGFMIENGIFKYPVSEITIAGNFNDIFKNIFIQQIKLKKWKIIPIQYLKKK